MKDFWNRWKREEAGAATVVEYSIVLPLCLFVIVCIFMMGYFLNQQANLDAAVNRGVTIAVKLYNDPNAEKIMDMGTSRGSSLVGYKRKNVDFSNLERDPYRYLNNGYKYDEMKSMIEAKIRNCIEMNQLPIIDSRVDEIEINFPEKRGVSGIINKNLTVNVTQDFQLPFLPAFLGKNGKGPVITLESTATITVINPTEFVRNVDFAADTVERFLGVDITEKMTTLFDKVTSFLETTK